jgi:calcineurin-like phosphoesterase family protein
VRKSVRLTTASVMVIFAVMAGSLAPASAATTTVTATADSFVLSTSPNANRGAATTLKVRSDIKITYIRFDVPALSGGETISAATLRVFATTTSKCTLGVEVLRAANDTWGEKTIKWSNQPGPTGSVLATGQWTTKTGYKDFNVTAAVTGGAPVSFLIRHAVGCNATGDVSFTSREATSNQPQLAVETTSGGPQPACSDGIDNDLDGFTDYPADPGCTSAADTDEANPPPAACADGIDNDLDGFTDYPADPGCTSAADDDETNPSPAACADGIDNDADGFTDYPADPGCTSAADTDETDPGSSHLIAAAGDIACDPTMSTFNGSSPNNCQHRATATLLTGAEAVLPLGDLQYEDGTLDQFTVSYDPSWGPFAPTTYPAVGNHEYHVVGAQGYFDYWTSKGRPTGGVGAGYYSYDIGAWHLIALNSNCSPVKCVEGTVQNDFLEQDLANTTKPCILAYWHHPLFNAGSTDVLAGPKAFWGDLYHAGADIVLNGHIHNYQRFGKQDPAGQAISNGVREFIVGTGGRSHGGTPNPSYPNFEFGSTTFFGVLKLQLGATSYSWEYVTIDGTVLDSGGPVSCN